MRKRNHTVSSPHIVGSQLKVMEEEAVWSGRYFSGLKRKGGGEKQEENKGIKNVSMPLGLLLCPRDIVRMTGSLASRLL